MKKEAIKGLAKDIIGGDAPKAGKATSTAPPSSGRGKQRHHAHIEQADNGGIIVRHHKSGGDDFSESQTVHPDLDDAIAHIKERFGTDQNVDNKVPARKDA